MKAQRLHSGAVKVKESFHKQNSCVWEADARKDGFHIIYPSIHAYGSYAEHNAGADVFISPYKHVHLPYVFKWDHMHLLYAPTHAWMQECALTWIDSGKLTVTAGLCDDLSPLSTEENNKVNTGSTDTEALVLYCIRCTLLLSPFTVILTDKAWLLTKARTEKSMQEQTRYTAREHFGCVSINESNVFCSTSLWLR